MSSLFLISVAHWLILLSHEIFARLFQSYFSFHFNFHCVSWPIHFFLRNSLIRLSQTCKQNFLQETLKCLKKNFFTTVNFFIFLTHRTTLLLHDTFASPPFLKDIFYLICFFTVLRDRHFFMYEFSRKNSRLRLSLSPTIRVRCVRWSHASLERGRARFRVDETRSLTTTLTSYYERSGDSRRDTESTAAAALVQRDKHRARSSSPFITQYLYSPKKAIN